MFKLGQHQFLAIFETKDLQPDRGKHFGIMVHDEAKIAETRQQLFDIRKAILELMDDFRGQSNP